MGKLLILQFATTGAPALHVTVEEPVTYHLHLATSFSVNLNQQLYSVISQPSP